MIPCEGSGRRSGPAALGSPNKRPRVPRCPAIRQPHPAPAEPPFRTRRVLANAPRTIPGPLGCQPEEQSRSLADRGCASFGASCVKTGVTRQPWPSCRPGGATRLVCTGAVLRSQKTQVAHDRRRRRETPRRATRAPLPRPGRPNDDQPSRARRRAETGRAGVVATTGAARPLRDTAATRGGSRSAWWALGGAGALGYGSGEQGVASLTLGWLVGGDVRADDDDSR